MKASRDLYPELKKLAAAKKALATAEKSLEEEITTKYKPRVQGLFPDKSNGRRLAFARWLTARQNPLTARVAVNHIWLRHFGQAIVPTTGRAPASRMVRAAAATTVGTVKSTTTSARYPAPRSMR